MKKKYNNGVTVVIPAYNEADTLKDAVFGVVGTIDKLIKDWEIIIIDDGSSDETGTIADGISAKNSKIKAIHHGHNRGFGYTFKEGIKLAQKEYITGFPGDNDTSVDLLTRLIRNREKADMVMGYMTNINERTFMRANLSKLFIFVMNRLFGMHLKYYNGYFIVRTELIRKIPLTSKGLTIFAEAKVRLISRNFTYLEVPFRHTKRKSGKSTAISWTNFIHTLAMIKALLTQVKIHRWFRIVLI